MGQYKAHVKIEGRAKLLDVISLNDRDCLKHANLSILKRLIRKSNGAPILSTWKDIMTTSLENSFALLWSVIDQKKKIIIVEIITVTELQNQFSHRN